VSRKLHDRNEKLSAAVRDIAWKAQLRLCSRYRRLAAVGKPKVVVTTAIARKMVGSWSGASLTDRSDGLLASGSITRRWIIELLKEPRPAVGGVD
jgi:hypothetical protein